MKEIVFVSIALGVVLGTFAGVAAARRIGSEVSGRWNVPLKLVRTGVLIGGCVVLLPSFFLSFVVGGNFGGGWGEFIAGRTGVVIGLAVGVAAVLALGIAVGAGAGGFLAASVHRAARRGGAS